MDDLNYEMMDIGYDPSRDSPYFCDSPESVACEADGFGSFHFNFAGRLGQPSNGNVRYKVPPIEKTKLEPVEFRSIERIVEEHNGLVDANQRMAGTIS